MTNETNETELSNFELMARLKHENYSVFTTFGEVIVDLPGYSSKTVSDYMFEYHFINTGVRLDVIYLSELLKKRANLKGEDFLQAILGSGIIDTTELSEKLRKMINTSYFN